MRRIALLLLIVLLPLQSVWAAAANACQGGCSSGGRDFGHHGHEHAGILVAADDASASTHVEHGTGCAADCSTYHGHGSAAVIPGARAPVTASRPGVIPSPYERFFAERFLESPLRPPQSPHA